MDNELTLTIDELAGRVGVPVRTVRFYISQGLLAGPGARGKGACYGEEHLLRLRLIRLLTEQRLPLATVRDRLCALSRDEVRALLATEEQHAAELDRATASPRDYVAALLRRAQAERGPIARAPAPPPGAPAPLAQALPDRNSLLREEMECCAAPQPRARDTDADAEPRPAGWRRWELAPGVELHVREDAEVQERGLIERLLRAARRR